MKLLLVALLTVSAAAADAARDTAWRQDLDTVATELPRRHPNLFFQTPRAVFDKAVADLRDVIPALNDVEVMVGLARIVALPGDAHTSLSLSQRNASFRLLPLQLRWFDDGLFVIGTGEGYARAAGAKVLRIGGVPAGEAYQAVAALISHENDSWVRENSPAYLVNNDILAALKLSSDNLSARFELQDRSGAVFALDIASSTPNIPAPVTPYPDPAAGFVPLWQRQGDLNYWFTYIESSRTLYFAYNRCAEMPALPFAQFNAQLWAVFDSRPVDRFVIDLRNNSGGNSNILAPFVASGTQRLQRFAATRPYVIVGRRTFSSGTLNAVELRQGPVITVGETSGGTPSAYGEIQGFTLPNSRLVIIYSTRLFSIAGAPSGPVIPDVRVPTMSADYFARHDPFFAAVMADARPSTPSAPAAVTVVSAATYRLGAVAPGSIAAAFGAWEAPAADAASLPLPTSLGGVQLFVNNAPAPLIAVRSGQINFLAPESTATGGASVRVVRNGEIVASGVFDVAAVAPGIFAGGAVLDGRELQLYGTGQGLAPLPAQVFAGAELVNVTYNGPQPSFPGLWQVNAEIPDGLASGETPVFIAIGGAASNGVTVQVGK